MYIQIYKFSKGIQEMKTLKIVKKIQIDEIMIHVCSVKCTVVQRNDRVPYSYYINVLYCISKSI